MIRALDVQQILIQSSAAQKLQQTQELHPDTEQKYLALQLNEARRLQQEKVNNAEEAERVTLRDKEERRERRKAPPEQRAADEIVPGDQGGEPSSEEQGEYIDIRV